MMATLDSRPCSQVQLDGMAACVQTASERARDKGGDQVASSCTASNVAMSLTEIKQMFPVGLNQEMVDLMLWGLIQRLMSSEDQRTQTPSPVLELFLLARAALNAGQKTEHQNK